MKRHNWYTINSGKCCNNCGLIAQKKETETSHFWPGDNDYIHYAKAPPCPGSRNEADMLRERITHALVQGSVPLKTLRKWGEMSHPSNW
jgi:hypothetical protein